MDEEEITELPEVPDDTCNNLVDFDLDGRALVEPFPNCRAEV